MASANRAIRAGGMADLDDTRNYKSIGFRIF